MSVISTPILILSEHLHANYGKRHPTFSEYFPDAGSDNNEQNEVDDNDEKERKSSEDFECSGHFREPVIGSKQSLNKYLEK